MKIFKLEPKEVIDKIYCDVCGECCTDENYGTESATLSAQWGYSSKKDGETYQIDLCEDCFDNTVSYLKSIRKGFEIDE